MLYVCFCTANNSSPKVEAETLRQHVNYGSVTAHIIGTVRLIDKDSLIVVTVYIVIVSQRQAHRFGLCNLQLQVTQTDNVIQPVGRTSKPQKKRKRQ